MDLGTLDDYFKTTPIGSINKAIGNNLYGINHQQVPGMVAINKDSYGLTFFVRPQLNLQKLNIANVRQLYPLLTKEDESIQRFVRCTLDPRLMAGYDRPGANVGVQGIQCPIVDNKNAFIPVLTNNIKSLSGWPDIVLPHKTSEPGLYKEEHAMADGIIRNFGSYDLDVTFANKRGDPILYMFYIWLTYASSVFEGRLLPYLDFITENEIDYNTRIYRLVLDSEKNYVRKIGATGVCFPISVPTGSFFDYTSEKPYNDQNKEISIRFKCMGAEYMDEILVVEFNQTVQIFNPDMRDEHRETYMHKLVKADTNSRLPLRDSKALFNNRGYPRINPDTYELEWWVDKSLYNAKISALQEYFGEAYV